MKRCLPVAYPPYSLSLTVFAVQRSQTVANRWEFQHLQTIRKWQADQLKR